VQELNNLGSSQLSASTFDIPASPSQKNFLKSLRLSTRKALNKAFFSNVC
jgi:hypothetical protein